MTKPIVDYTYLQNTVWKLKAVYPFLRIRTIGKSVVGRSIYALELGRETAPGVLLAGTFLGTDATSGLVLLNFCEQLLKALQEKSRVALTDPYAMLRNRKIIILPVVNPDGREICARGTHCGGLDSGRVHRLCGGHSQAWAANVRGVEIARNFDFEFEARRKRERSRGIYGPGMAGYSGPSAESEPEAAALADYCRSQQLLHAVSFYPGKGEVYWRNLSGDAYRAEQMGHLLSLSAGYDVEASVGKITDTGFRNWFNQTTRQPALDVMIREEDHNPTLVLEDLLIAACLM